MSEIPQELRRAVIARARNCCEYCGLSQIGQEAAFHIDHVIPRVAQGATVLENLALACVSCSLRKGAKELSLDPQTQQAVALFNPRLERWSEHFQWQGEQIIALTATGRATIHALALNRPLILAIRREEALRGRHP